MKRLRAALPTKPCSKLSKHVPSIVLISFALACAGSSDSDDAGETDGAASQDDSASAATDPTGDPDATATADGESGSNDGSGDSTSDGTSDDASDSSSDSSSDGANGTEEPVDLGAAGDFVILAKSGISDVPPCVITGDVGLSPAAASFITGFSLIADPTNVFATSDQVTGSVFAADYEVPTPADLTGAVSDMELAFTDAAGRAADVTELGAGDIGGMTLEPGVYKWGTGLLVPTDVTLEGSSTDVWIFQIAQDLTVSNGTNMVLTGGALPENVFWQVAGLVEVGTTAHVEGVVLTQTSIAMRTGATINGRLLAQTAVVLDTNTVVEPAN